ncbi:PepSY domain-containing protein [Polymorphobacter sp.]|uniref:PepSY domain-containing protein n=1 Tax=Polymorphobacter sp. TaxID=1909290 RepID=UPI003F6F934C
MRRLSSSFLLALAPLLLLAGTAHAGVEKRVRDMVEAGEIIDFETIRSRVTSQVRGDYIGVQFDEPTLTYRFRFMVDGELINVDVDARTGQRRRAIRSY